MKIESSLIILGIAMVSGGLVLFYSIQSDPNLADSLRFIKHGGTFAGLMGIGIIMAGILLHLIGKGETQIPEDFDV